MSHFLTLYRALIEMFENSKFLLEDMNVFILQGLFILFLCCKSKVNSVSIYGQCGVISFQTWLRKAHIHLQEHLLRMGAISCGPLMSTEPTK